MYLLLLPMLKGNITRLPFKDQLINAQKVKKIIPVYNENHMQRINTLTPW